MRLHLVVFLVLFRTTSEEQFHPERKSREKIQSDGFQVRKTSAVVMLVKYVDWKKYFGVEFV